MDLTISITPEAAAHLRAMLKPESGVHISLTSTGCTGLSPAFEAFSLSNADMIASSQSVDGLIISASPAVQRFGEIEVLMRDNGVNKLLDISSPNISNRCGCGATFG